MAFAGYLNNAELRELTEAAKESDLLELERPLLLQGIYKGFIFGLTRSPIPLNQFLLDLNALNFVERLENGEVPLVQFLQNAATQLRLRGRTEAEIFEKTANRIGNRTRGVTNLPDPAQLPEVTKNEAIIGSDDTVDFTFLAAGTAVGRSVARVLVPRFEGRKQVMGANGKPWVMVGTAWLVAPQLLITNHHVINARISEENDASHEDWAMQSAGAVAEFDYDTEETERITKVKITSVVAEDKNLDYALLQLESDPQRAALKLRGQRIQVDATTYLPVNIIQHPRGKAKRVAFRNNLVTASDADTIRYFTDTDFGSSGSPVCDDRWRVVALHRGAKYVQDVKYQGKSTAYVNFGSQICAVLEQLKQNNAGLYGTIRASQPELN